MTMNDIDGPGGVEDLLFSMYIFNNAMTYDNEYNINPTEYYKIGGFFDDSLLYYPAISSFPPDYTPTPMDSFFKFFALPDINDDGNPIINGFNIKLEYSDNIGNNHSEILTFSGPIGFAPVPEPMSMVLFAFGAFLLKFITKRK